ncbi:MAG: hypothetical protein AB7P49_03930 [Bdellovibrionales bacterium]
MRNGSIHILLISLLMTAAALAGCGKKKGGGGEPPPAAPPGAVGVYENCAGTAVNTQLFAGAWKGQVVALNINSSQFQNFLYESRLCYGYQCQNISPYLDIQIDLIRGGFTYGPGEFSLWTYQQGYYPGGGKKYRGDACVNTANNGFNVDYRLSGGGVPFPGGGGHPGYPSYPGYPYGSPYGGGYGVPYTTPTTSTTNNSIRVQVQWADTTRTRDTIQL